MRIGMESFENNDSITLCGDAWEKYKAIDRGSVDLILTDPPYGNMRNAPLDGWGKEDTNWDVAIEPNKIFAMSTELLRHNGRLILFSQEPYTSQLITNAKKALPFNYRLIWLKDNHANPLMAKKAPLNYYEDILVFTKVLDVFNDNPLRTYFAKVQEYIKKPLSRINQELGHRRAEHSFYTTSTQFSLCTRKTYEELSSKYQLFNMGGFLTYDELKEISEKYSPTFNLPKNKTHRKNVMKFKKDYDGHHPTQKPTLLLEELIETYSNIGDVVLDLTMGSGSTGVACKNTNRKFIGIELEEEYFKIAEKRIKGE